jgi:hypothetical protein
MNNQSEMLLDMLQLYSEHNFEGITTGDESWFLCTTCGDSMFATSVREVVSRTKQNVSAMKTIVTIFFTLTRLLVLNFMPIYTTKRDELRGTRVYRVFNPHGQFNVSKITEKHEKRHIVRAPRPPYLPDLCSCDYWLFGVLKQKMKERVFQSEERILVAVTESWNKLTFEDIQRISYNRMESLIWVIANSGEYYQ